LTEERSSNAIVFFDGDSFAYNIVHCDFSLRFARPTHVATVTIFLAVTRMQTLTFLVCLSPLNAMNRLYFWINNKNITYT